MQTSVNPVIKDLVLIGGGHAHVAVLRHFGMRPLDGLRITLISRDIHTPYSGMLPGYIAGHYDYDQCHIDLAPLCRFARARLYHNEVSAVDLAHHRVHAEGRPAITFDFLSVNCGARPNTLNVPGAEEFALVVKPVDIFLQRWQKLQNDVINSRGEFHIAVVGGGAGGVELALAVRYRLRKLLAKRGEDAARLKFCLLTQGAKILPAHHASVQRRFIKILAERNIRVLFNHAVNAVGEDFVCAANGRKIATNAVIFVTHAESPAWPRQSGLDVDADGFIRVNKYLQSTSHAGVFAAGDIVSLPEPRAKSGVFAVRQSRVLSRNLASAVTEKRLTAYRPQKHFLGLISTGDKYAVAARANWSWQAGWLWRLKDWVDRRFMQKFNRLPDMQMDMPAGVAGSVADENTIRALSAQAVRCGGCGAKVGSRVLARVMQRLPADGRQDVLMGRNSADDCAMLVVPENKVMVQSVDYFRAFIDDAYQFGAIAANHALGDIYAMGAQPQSALAIAALPYGREKVVEETLYELLAGALHTLQPSGAVLAGGHSAEGAELAFGLIVNGLIKPDKVWRKQGLRPGDALLLTKPIGTGTLFAADMRAKAKGRWVHGAIAGMRHSSQAAAQCLQKYSVHACTDVTGFGLIGHLLEMTRASQVRAEIDIAAVPLLAGAAQTAALGLLSSLQPQNLRLRGGIENIQQAAAHPHYALLFDPQTAGGLLAGLAPREARQCIDELHALGYKDACIIGRATARTPAQAPIKILL